MTIDATDPAFRNRMVTGQIILAAYVRVTGVTDGLSGSRRVHREPPRVAAGLGPSGRETVRRLGFASGFGVNAAGPVTGFAAGIQGIWSFGD